MAGSQGAQAGVRQQGMAGSQGHIGWGEAAGRAAGYGTVNGTAERTVVGSGGTHWQRDTGVGALVWRGHLAALMCNG
jgi:hypothetical protein